jgi:hypothetical protein
MMWPFLKEPAMRFRVAMLGLCVVVTSGCEADGCSVTSPCESSEIAEWLRSSSPESIPTIAAMDFSGMKPAVEWDHWQFRLRRVDVGDSYIVLASGGKRGREQLTDSERNLFRTASGPERHFLVLSQDSLAMWWQLRDVSTFLGDVEFSWCVVLATTFLPRISG